MVEESIAVERRLPFSSIGPHSAPTLRRLAALKPRTLAIMHGLSYRRYGAAALGALARICERRLTGD